MTVQAILNDKGADVIAIGSGEKISNAVEVMHRRHIGALVVAAEGSGMVGIFTERDVIRALAAHGAAVLDEPISKHMTERPTSVEPDMAVDEAMAIMTERKFRHLPIMNNGSLAGIISIGDLVNFKIHQTESEARAMREYIAS